MAIKYVLNTMVAAIFKLVIGYGVKRCQYAGVA